MTGRVRNVVGAGVLSGVLLIALAVAAPGDGLRSATGGASNAAPASVAPPGNAVAAGDSGGHAVTDDAGFPKVADNEKKATQVAQTTGSTPRAATSTAGQPAPVRPGAQGGHVTDPVPPAKEDPPASKGDDTTGGDTGGGDTGGGNTGGGNTGGGDTGGGDTGGGDTGGGSTGGGDTGGGDTGGGDTGGGDTGGGDTTPPSDPPPPPTSKA